MKHADRIWLLLFWWLLIPLGILVQAIILPCFWVLKYGYTNSPFFHNVKAGFLITFEAAREAWRN